MFHKPIEYVFDRSVLERSDSLSSKWDRILWRSRQEHLRMGSLNRWTYSDNVISFLERKEWTRHRSLNCGTRSPKFNASFHSKLPALECDRLKVTPKMVEHSMSCTSQLTNLIFKKQNSYHKFHSLNYEKSEHTIG